MMLEENEVVATVEELTLTRLRDWVQLGWIQPSEYQARPHFQDIDIARIRLICHLQDHLNVNDDSVPVILSLVDQLHGVRHELRTVIQAIKDQP